jgi:hypothetical protein
VVKLYGVLRSYRPAAAGGLPHQPFNWPIGGAATVDGLARQLAIPEGLVSAAAVNGVSADGETTLRPGDEVSLFPAAAGG